MEYGVYGDLILIYLEPYSIYLRGAIHLKRSWSTSSLLTLLTYYLEGHGDSVSRLMSRTTRVTIWVIGDINLLTKPL